MKKIILATILLASVGSQAQGLMDKIRGGSTVKLFKEETLDEQYKKHVGEVLFSNEEFTKTLPESKCIKTYKLGDLLFVRAFFANSPINNVMLQLEASGMKPQKINQSRDEFKQNVGVDYRLFFDGKQVTRSAGGKPEDMLSVPSYATRLNDKTDSGTFGKDLYVDLLKRTDLLVPGTHKLKIEVFPEIRQNGTGSDFEFKSIAVGEIDIIIPETKATPESCFPVKRLSDAKLEAEVMKAVKNANPNAFKVIITSSQPTIMRDEYNTILRKRFYAAIVNKKGTAMTCDMYVFDKEFNGTGYEDTVISKDMENALLPKKIYVNPDCIKFLK